MATKIDIDKDDLSHGLMGLVIALVEIIRDALRLQAERRIEGGSLTEEEIERLGLALEKLDREIERLKREQGVREAVENVRGSLDDLANEIVNKAVNLKEPERGERIAAR